VGGGGGSFGVGGLIFLQREPRRGGGPGRRENKIRAKGMGLYQRDSWEERGPDGEGEEGQGQGGGNHEAPKKQ